MATSCRLDISKGVRVLSQGRADDAGEGIAMMLAVALPVYGVVGLTMLMEGTAW